jgi:hypothetical protein
MKKCLYYDVKKTLEQNKKEAAEKIKAKQETRKLKKAEKNGETEASTPGNMMDQVKSPGRCHPTSSIWTCAWTVYLY